MKISTGMLVRSLERSRCCLRNRRCPTACRCHCLRHPSIWRRQCWHSLLICLLLPEFFRRGIKLVTLARCWEGGLVYQQPFALSTN